MTEATKVAAADPEAISTPARITRISETEFDK